MSRPATAEITPRPGADQCEADGCGAGELLADVDPVGAASSQILCPTHRVEYLREVTNE